MKAFVSGGAGFIGSNLVDRLLDVGHEVTVYDNLSTGLLQFLEYARDFDRFRLVEGDLLDEGSLSEAIAGHEFVFHLAANADVRFGTEHSRRDLEQNTIVTNKIWSIIRALEENDHVTNPQYKGNSAKDVFSSVLLQIFKCAYFQTEAHSRLEEVYNIPIMDSHTGMILLYLWLVNVATLIYFLFDNKGRFLDFSVEVFLT